MGCGEPVPIVSSLRCRVLRGDRAETVTLCHRRKDESSRTLQAGARNFLKDPAVGAVIVLTRDLAGEFNAAVRNRKNGAPRQNMDHDTDWVSWRTDADRSAAQARSPIDMDGDHE